MRLQPDTEHPHGLSDRDYDALFTVDKPVIFAYHGYPWLIHRLAYRRAGAANLHVRGYKEEGTVTTPFDMLVRNDMDRFHLVMDVIDRVPGLGTRAAHVRQHMVDERTRHQHYTRDLRRGSPRGAGLEVDRPRVRLLVVNAGSSSLKLSVLDDADAGRRRRTTIAQWDGRRRADRRVRGARSAAIDAVGHRVVHGGIDVHRSRSSSTTAWSRSSAELAALAPLHQPRALAAIAAARARAAAGATHVACFDTAFHATLPPAAHVYALPAEWRHALAAAALRLPRPLARVRGRGAPRELAGRPLADAAARLVSPRRGRVAVRGARRAVRRHDDGLHAARRSRHGDPGRDDRSRPRPVADRSRAASTPSEVLDGLEQRERARRPGRHGRHARGPRAPRRAATPDATLAFDVYAHRLRRELGAMRAALDRLRRVRVHRRRGGARARRARARAGSTLDPVANAATTRRRRDQRARARRSGRSSSPPAKTSRSRARFAAVAGVTARAAAHDARR